MVGAERPFFERAEGTILVVHVRGHASSASDGGPIAVDIEEPSPNPSQIAGCATRKRRRRSRYAAPPLPTITRPAPTTP